MTPVTRRSVLGALGAASVGAVLVSPSAGAAAGRVPRDLLPGGAFDRSVAEQAALDRFSGTVLLAHRGRPVLTRSYGMANKQSSVPNRPDTSFNLASVTKCFTGLAILQLAARDLLVLHEKLGTYLDGFPAEIANTVTIHQLLTHTSGVGRPALGSGPPPGSEGGTTVEEVFAAVLATIRGLPTQFQPGTRFGYSNDAFWVLGAIVAAVSGQSFVDYARSHIFQPAGMTHTGFFTKPQVLADPMIARPYWTQRSGDRADFTASPFFGFVRGPDSGAYATAPDLVRFTTALMSGKLLPGAYVDLLTSGKFPVPARSPEARHWHTAYGFETFIVADQRSFGHPGNGPGTATNLDIYPASDWVSSILSNYDTPIDPIIALSRKLITS